MLLLASRSPRRRSLLEAAGIPFRVGPAPDVDESLPPGLDPAAAARALAERKARVVLTRYAPAIRKLAAGALVLTADTLVYLSATEVLGKPADPADAERMLARLSGRTHSVATGVALADPRRIESGVDVTQVTFRTLEPLEIEAYVRGGEPLDKAGAYGIQGGARSFVARVEGAEDTVIGLPIALVRTLLARLRPERPGPRGLGSGGIASR